MTAAYTGNVSTPGGVLHLAFELGWTHWKLAFTIGYGQKLSALGPLKHNIQGYLAVDYYNVPIVNRPTSFIRQDGIASGRWDFSPALTTTLEYHWQAWNRTFRDAPRTDENSGKIRLDFTPSTAVTVRADYQYGKRSLDLYKTVPFTFVPATNPVSFNPR